MSTENNNSVDLATDDLDLFSATFFGQNKAQPEPASSEEKTDDVVEEPESDASKTEDTHEEADTLENDETDETEEGEEATDEEPKPEVKPKKNRAQERIEELNKKYREEQRARVALEERLAKLEQQNEKPEPVKKVAADIGPSPDDKHEDGTEKYPLGEFDPNYIRDLTRFTLAQEREMYKVKEEQEREQLRMDEQRAELQASWREKVDSAQERYPDLQEKGEQLLETFEGIDATYGEYLASTIMSMEFGPDVLYYLANNVDEAQKIVNSGPTKATIALGRLESKFAFANEEKQKARPKVSQAPTPPPLVNKGSAPAKIEPDDDTDDLDAFSKKFFKKK